MACVILGSSTLIGAPGPSQVTASAPKERRSRSKGSRGTSRAMWKTSPRKSVAQAPASEDEAGAAGVACCSCCREEEAGPVSLVLLCFVVMFFLGGEKAEIKDPKKNAARWVGPKGSRRRRRVPHGDGISVRATLLSFQNLDKSPPRTSGDSASPRKGKPAATTRARIWNRAVGRGTLKKIGKRADDLLSGVC